MGIYDFESKKGSEANKKNSAEEKKAPPPLPLKTPQIIPHLQTKHQEGPQAFQDAIFALHKTHGNQFVGTLLRQFRPHPRENTTTQNTLHREETPPAPSPPSNRVPPSILGGWVFMGSGGAAVVNIENPIRRPDGSLAGGLTGEVLAAGVVGYVSGIRQDMGVVSIAIPRIDEQGQSSSSRQVWIDGGGIGGSALPPQTQAEESSSQDQSDAEDVQHASADLGSISRFDNSFYDGAGHLLDALLPSEGSEGKLEVRVNIPWQGVQIFFDFKLDASRGHKLKVRCQLGLGVLASADLWLARVFLEIQGFGYIEVQGDSGAECFRLMSMSIEHRIRQVPRFGPPAADAVWGGRFDRAVLNEMDEEDYAESGLGLGYQMGARVGRPGEGASVHGGRSDSVGTRITAENGHMRTRSTSVTIMTLGGSVEDNSLELKGTIHWAPDRTVESVSVKAKLKLSIELNSAAAEMLVTLIGSAVSTVTQLMQSNFHGDSFRVAGLIAQQLNAQRNMAQIVRRSMGREGASEGEPAEISVILEGEYEHGHASANIIIARTLASFGEHENMRSPGVHGQGEVEVPIVVIPLGDGGEGGGGEGGGHE